MLDASDFNWVHLPAVGEYPDMFVNVEMCMQTKPCKHMIRKPEGEIRYATKDHVRELFEERLLPVPKHFRQLVKK